MESDMKKRVLFVCRHNSARSQMAEAFLNQLGGDRFKAESAGLNPKTILPTAATVMREIGLDISDRPTRSVNDLYLEGEVYDYVITVCDDDSAEECPVFDYPCRHLRWNFDEPSQFIGSPEEILEQTRQVRDQIRHRILQWRDGS
jgi:arsenate reductase